MKSVYALLVGIDDYPPPVPRLRGCVNDVREMAAYLSARVAGTKDGPGALEQQTLLNAEATRDAVVRGFRSHLARAGAEDVALFCYSGHGSQELAPEEFWPLEPDHFNETLVCYDSRVNGSWDLADKELARLIAEVATGGAHVVVVLDCCHSGSGTRTCDLAQTAVRRIEADLRKRPLDSYVAGAAAVGAVGGTRGGHSRSAGWIGAGRHVLLAACRDDEEAKEFAGGGTTRGAFSYFLGETLRTAGPSLTYRDLFTRASSLVRGQVQRQSPQLEATVAEDLSRPFLGGTLRPAPSYFVASVRGGGWTVDAGRVHGIPAPGEDAAEFGLFDFRAPDEELAHPGRAVGTARVTQVSAAASEVAIAAGTVDPTGAPFKAVLTHLPIPRLRVRLEGDARGTDPVRSALAGSRFVREAVGGEAADYRLLARDECYLIAKPDDDRPVVGQIAGYTGPSARAVTERLEHLQRWKTTAELDNPGTSIGPAELEIEVLRDGAPLAGPEIRLEYSRRVDGTWVNPEITLRLRNTGRRTLFVGLLDLPQTFGIFTMLADVGCQKLEPGQETYANRGEPIPVTIPDQFWARGGAEFKDIIKVIVGTSEFDARRLAQDDLDLPREEPRSAALGKRGVATRAPTELGTLERLMERVQTGTRHAAPAAARRIDDWRAFQFAFTTVRPLAAARLEPGRGVVLTGGVRIEPHPALRAGAVRLTGMPAATRAVGTVAPLPRLLCDDPLSVQPFELTGARALDTVLNVLEFEDLADPGAVTCDHPLRVVVPRPLGADEEVLPVGFDGEFFLPLGRAEAAGAETVLLLERLPALEPAASRSLGGALRIFVHKVVSRYFGTEYHYPILAAAETGPDGRARYEPDATRVRERVAAATRIVLFVHGIIGDTRVMATSLERAGIAGRYDLALTFDYESLNEPIADSARALKQRLEAVGLGPDHGKAVDVVAHSMGGLVARWFIEREGGTRQVRRLVMLGTPNGGSPWPRVADWATNALALGLNGLSSAAWPAVVLTGLVKAARWANVTLDQLKADSLFLRDLSGSPDPEIPYIAVIGNTSLVARPTGDGDRRSRLRRLIGQLWSDRTKYELADLFFGGAENDLAVSTSSMMALPGRRSAVEAFRVACDHLTYFTDLEALKALEGALR
jgi:hypothetical protein